MSKKKSSVKKQKPKKERNNSKKWQITDFLMNPIIMIILIFIILVVFLKFNHKERKSITEVKSELVSVQKISNLYTGEFDYNGIATKTEEGKDAYYVRYEGEVKAGIDLDEIEIKENNIANKIIVTIPKVKIIGNPILKTEKLDIIPLNSKYKKSEDVHPDAVPVALQDLKNEVKKDKTFLKMAQAKCESYIRGLFEPIILADNNYELVIESED